VFSITPRNHKQTIYSFLEISIVQGGYFYPPCVSDGLPR